MKWIELSVSTPPEFVEPLSELFHRYGHGGVAVEQNGGYNPDEGESPPDGHVRVVTYVPREEFTQERRSRVDMGVRLVAHLAPISTLVERELEQEDWENAWKEHFHPLRIGEKVVIVPSWREYLPEHDDVVVRLDPGMAFGTGHHPTTKMCIELLEEHVRPSAEVLDLGCGSGILSIVSAKLGASRVTAVEIDDVATKAAKSNVEANEVDVIVIEGSLPHPNIPKHGFDVTVANISSRVVTELAPHLVGSVRPGGVLIASGILEEAADRVADILSEHGAVVEQRLTEEDWVAFVATVPGPETTDPAERFHLSLDGRGSRACPESVEG